MYKTLKSYWFRGILLIQLAGLSFASLGQSSVWKATKEGSSVYLAGTIHLLRESDYPLPGEYDIAYNNSQKIVMEADIDAASDPKMVQSMLKMMLYQDERSLKTELKPETYERLKEAADEVGLPMFGLAKMKPGMATTTISMMKLKNNGVGEAGVDMYYLEKAKEDSKEVLFLESAESQLELLANMGMDNPDKFVQYTLDEMEKSNEDFDKMVKTWRKGKSKKIGKEMAEMKKTSPEAYKSLLLTRNNNWMPLIEEHIKNDGTEMIMVGNAHLLGPDGIIKQLKDKGYTIKQVKD